MAVGQANKKRDLFDKQKIPKEEFFGLTSQLRRSTNSISDNLAEGSGRATSSDKARFRNMSYSSSLETTNHLIGAYDLGYLDEESYNHTRQKMNEIINKLNSIYRYQLKNEQNLKDQI